MSKYEPQIDDYVKWKNDVEGWVYFKDREYITIEMLVRPKDDNDLQNCTLHRNHRLLVICYREQWDQLEYVKRREFQTALSK